MKIIKETDQAILLNYYGVKDRFYLAVSILTFFGFDSPDQPLKEQEMWPFVQGELGKDAILDLAMPKLQGEALVWGKCFAPGGKPAKALDVSFQLGPIQKQLYIFGDRRWSRLAGKSLTVSEPEPFLEIPLTYSRAFGGPGFDLNPLGKGFAPAADASGNTVHLLPNIEHPDHVIGSPGDRPEPAGFAPLDSTWPQRARKMGTYDNRWLQERWPFYPDDMDWTYFNAAPQDQQLKDVYFRGDEIFSLKNLHPEKRLITSKLPGLRQRCFINQLAEPNDRKGEVLFKEVKTRAETVWLFPHAERGIVIFRGAAPVADDEALDVIHLFVAAEGLADEPGTLEDYYDIFKKRLDRSVPAEFETHMAEARKKIAAAKETFKDLPLQISDSIDQGLGLAPRVEKSPQEIIADGISRIDKSKSILEMGEKQAAEAKARFGHIMKIDPGRFTAAKKNLDDLKQSLVELSGRADQAMAKAAKERERAGKGLQEIIKKIDPATLKLMREKNIPLPSLPPDPLETPREKLWHKCGMRFLERCRENLENNPDALNALRQLGLRRYIIRRSWLGLNSEEAVFSAQEWGLEPEDIAGGDRIIIPPGLIIPCFEKADLVRITVRPWSPAAGNVASRITDASSDVIVRGSNETAMAIGSSDKPYLRVRDDMEAVLMFQEAGNACAVISMKDTGTKPDEAAGGFIKNTPQFLVAGYPDSDPQELASWAEISPESEWLAIPPGGLNLFEARRSGADLAKWVMDALRPGLAPVIEEDPQYPDDDPRSMVIPVPRIDVQGLMKRVRETVENRTKPGQDHLESKKKEMLDAARKAAASRGIDLDKAMKPPPHSAVNSPNPFAAAKEQWIKKFAETREEARKRGMLSPALEKKLGDAESHTIKMADDASARYEDGMAKLAAGKEKAAAGLPDWARDLFARFGINPDDQPLKALTREEVLKIYAAGNSLSGRNLSEADLSGLDLRGINLRKAMLQKTIFRGCNLDGADLGEALAGEADFSGASLRETQMAKGIFQKAKFAGANLSGSDLKQALLNDADLAGADLSGATLDKALLENANMVKARCPDANAATGYFFSADLTGADLSGADLEKAVFLKAKLDEAKLKGSRMRSAFLIESKGDNIDFSGADMFNSRMVKESAFPNADFTKVKASKACWMNSDLSTGDFRGSEMEMCLIQECDLNGSNLSGIKARQARFTKSDLSGADMRGINLFTGSLRKSKLVKTDLREANLFGAEFFRTGVGETNFEDANLKMTKLQGRVDLIPGKKK